MSFIRRNAVVLPMDMGSEFCRPWIILLLTMISMNLGALFGDSMTPQDWTSEISGALCV